MYQQPQQFIEQSAGKML